MLLCFIHRNIRVSQKIIPKDLWKSSQIPWNDSTTQLLFKFLSIRKQISTVDLALFSTRGLFKPSKTIVKYAIKYIKITGDCCTKHKSQKEMTLGTFNYYCLGCKLYYCSITCPFSTSAIDKQINHGKTRDTHQETG
jgi:hypothetical protein